MERSGKRKASDFPGKLNGKRKKRPKEERGGGVEEERTPTAEEVEEFFAILRRMQTARNHFLRSEANLTERWRLALGIDRSAEEEKEKSTEGDDDHKSAEESGQLDLNEVPVEFENTNDGSMIGKASRME